MKFNLNITDMNEEEFAKLFASINVPCKTEVTVVSKTDIVPSEETVNYDIDGLQWDARIHSSNHKINSDGRWQRRRGISDEEFNRVKNELLGVQEPVAEVAPVEAPVVAPAPVAPAVTVAQTPMGEYTTVAPVAPFVAPVVAPVVAPAPIAPTPIAPVAPAVAPEPTPVIDSAVLYQTMFEKIKIGMNNQKVGPNDIKTLVEAVNSQFGLQYTTLAQVKDNIPALQFVINDLTARGL